MQKFYNGVLNRKKTVLILFLSLFVLSLLCSKLVAVNYDMTDYLPANTQSTVSLEILKDDLEHCLRIPMNDKVRSLNLSNCAAIVLYEVLRQQDYPNLLRTEPHKGEDWLIED